MTIHHTEATGIQASRVLRGGFVATVVITLLMYFGAPLLADEPLDVSGALSMMLGAPWSVGMIIHFVLGTVVFSLAYALVVGPRLPGRDAVRGALWGTILWLIAMTMTGKPLFLGSAPAAIASLIAHLGFGVTLGLLIPLAGNKR